MFNEEIEEVRELLYNIVKDYPTGITSTFLEEQYSNRYVQARLANPLPVNWLSLLRQAEEFRVRDVSTYTLLYLADARIPHQPEQWETIASQQQEGTPHLSTDLISAEPDEIHSSCSHRPQTEHQNGNSNLGLDLQQLQQPQAQLAQFTFDQFEPAPLSSMTTNEPIEIRIISALDPDTIFFRLGAWDPYCAYLYAALSHLPSLDLEGSSLLRTGQVLGAKIDGKWERVVLIRRSTAQSDYWIVNMVDAGNFHGVHVKAFRPLTEAITAFKKIFLAMCKLDRIQSRMINQLPNELAGTNDEFRSRVRWPPESQHYISEALQPATLKEKRVELVPFGEWGFHRERRIPMCTGRLLIEEVDFGEQLVSMGLAQRM